MFSIDRENTVWKARIPVRLRAYAVKPRLHVQFFPRDGNSNFKKLLHCRREEKNCTCSMSCAGNATSSEKLPKFICQQILPSHSVAGLQFFRTWQRNNF